MGIPIWIWASSSNSTLTAELLAGRLMNETERTTFRPQQICSSTIVHQSLNGMVWMGQVRSCSARPPISPTATSLTTQNRRSSQSPLPQERYSTAEPSFLPSALEEQECRRYILGSPRRSERELLPAVTAWTSNNSPVLGYKTRFSDDRRHMWSLWEGDYRQRKLLTWPFVKE